VIDRNRNFGRNRNLTEFRSITSIKGIFLFLCPKMMIIAFSVFRYKWICFFAQNLRWLNERFRNQGNYCQISCNYMHQCYVTTWLNLSGIKFPENYIFWVSGHVFSTKILFSSYLWYDYKNVLPSKMKNNYFYFSVSWKKL